MMIFNQTIIIEPTIEYEWLAWMQNVHIRAVIQTGYFQSYRILKVLESPNEGITYCVQFTAAGKQDYDAYIATASMAHKNTHFKKFENKFVMFESIMQLVDEYESDNNSH